MNRATKTSVSLLSILAFVLGCKCDFLLSLSLDHQQEDQTSTIVLQNQSEINAFFKSPLLVDGILNANLVINKIDAIDLNFLSKLKRVEGFLYVTENSQLTSLAGLEALEYIANDLIITRNDRLQNLNALSNITGIQRNLIISDNQNLCEIDGLSQIKMVDRDLSISNNDQLVHLNGLQSLQAVGGYFSLTENLKLTEVCGLSALQVVGEDLNIFNNKSLDDLSCLPNLRFREEGEIFVKINPKLDRLK